jgi:aspartate kinase
VLLSISANDYSFISESHLSEIFGLFAKHHVKVNMMQTSALSFTACIDYAAERFEKLLQGLKETFKVRYNNELTLITLRHYTNAAVDEVTTGKTVLMKQTSRNTAQVVLK